MIFPHAPALTLAASLAAAALLLGGCAAVPGATPESDQPVEGGSITYLEPLAFTNVYPPGSTANQNSIFVNQIADRLVNQNSETFEIEPWLAESWAYNDDRTVLTLVLRDDVTFSDGTPLDAAAVVANLELYGNGDPERGLTTSESLDGYDYSTAIDDDTVEIHLERPVRSFLQGLSAVNSGIYAPSSLELESFAVGDLENVIGTGPFYVDSEEVGENVVVKAREDYDWAPASWEHQGRAYLDQITWVFTPEDSVRVGALLAGQAEAIRAVEAQDEQRVRESDNAEVLAPLGYGLVSQLQFRISNHILRDHDVREALVRATDVQELHDTIVTDSFPLATSLFIEDTGIARDLTDTFAFDPERAAALLDEAGWELGADGYRYSGGERLTFTAAEIAAVSRSIETLTLLAEQWKKLGIELLILPADDADYAAAVADPERVQIRQTSAYRADPDVIAAQFAVTGGRNALLNTDPKTKELLDPELEERLDAVLSAETEEAAVEAAQAAEDYVLEQSYVVPLWGPPLVQGTSTHLKGWTFGTTARPIFHSLWLDQQ